MIDTKTGRECDELHRTIWAIADERQGVSDEWNPQKYELRDLNDIERGNRKGIYKRGLLTDKQSYSRMCDYMQKVNFCIQDLNTEMQNLNNLDRKSVVYIIALVDWISEAVRSIRELYEDKAIAGFSYEKEEELKKAKKYLCALRSFAVAHPLTTDRHSDYDMDGKMICVDIITTIPKITILPNKYYAWLDYDGYHRQEKRDSDFYLYGYSEEINNMKFAVYIGCSLIDIYHVAELYIEKLYALDKHLSKQKCR